MHLAGIAVVIRRLARDAIKFPPFWLFLVMITDIWAGYFIQWYSGGGGGGGVAQIVELASTGEEVLGSIPTVAAGSILVGSMSV